MDLTITVMGAIVVILIMLVAAWLAWKFFIPNLIKSGSFLLGVDWKAVGDKLRKK